MGNTFQRCTARAALVVSFAALLYSPSVGLAGPITLGLAQSFAVLGHETVTNNHSDPNPQTKIYGNLGVTPGTAVTGFPPGIVSGGAIHTGLDGVAVAALAAAGAAYGTLITGPLPYDYNYTGIALGTLGTPGYASLSPGIYHFDTTAQLLGKLTLDFGSTPGANFIFQIGTSLTTGSASSVEVIGGDPLSGVYWQVGSQANLGPDTTFAGNILAGTSVVLDPRAEILCGRAFALTGQVTLIDNLITNNCIAEDFGSGRSDFGSYGFSGGGSDTQGIPEPGTLTLLSVGLGAGFLLLRKFRSIR